MKLKKRWQRKNVRELIADLERDARMFRKALRTGEIPEPLWCIYQSRIFEDNSDVLPAARELDRANPLPATFAERQIERLRRAHDERKRGGEVVKRPRENRSPVVLCLRAEECQALMNYIDRVGLAAGLQPREIYIATVEEKNVLEMLRLSTGEAKS